MTFPRRFLFEIYHFISLYLLLIIGLIIGFLFAICEWCCNCIGRQKQKRGKVSDEKDGRISAEAMELDDEKIPPPPEALA